MLSNPRSEKREKSTSEFVVVIIVFALLMKVFIDYFFEQEKYISSAGFSALSQNFNNTVLAVHAQWLMDQKPAVIWLASLDKKSKVAITINAKGWIDVTNQFVALNKTTACEKIWQLTMTVPMELMKFSIAAIEIQDKKLKDFTYCRYLLPSGEYFDYRSATGKVSEVTQTNTR